VQRELLPKKSLSYRYGLVYHKAVADRYRLAAYLIISTADELFGSANIDDLDRP